MMRLVLKSEETSLTFLKEKMSVQDVTAAFNLFAGKIDQPQQEAVATLAEEPVLRKAVEKTEEPKPRPRAIDLLNSERTLSEPIEQSARIVRAKVKVYVNCPHCGHEADQDTYRGHRFTHCRGCNEKLFLRPSTGTWGEEDENGYEYFALNEYHEARVP